MRAAFRPLIALGLVQLAAACAQPGGLRASDLDESGVSAAGERRSAHEIADPTVDPPAPQVPRPWALRDDVPDADRAIRTPQPPQPALPGMTFAPLPGPAVPRRR